MATGQLTNSCAINTITSCSKTTKKKKKAFFSGERVQQPLERAMSNVTTSVLNCTSLSFIFDAPQVTPTVINDDVGAIVIQSIPTALTILYCTLVEWVWWTRRTINRPMPSRLRRRLALLLSSLAIGLQVTMLWHVASILDCDGTVSILHGTPFFPIILTLSCACVDTLVLLCVVPRSPRMAMLTFVSLAATSVLVDWMLRGGIVVSKASRLLVAVQQTFDILVIACIHFVPGYTLLLHVKSVHVSTHSTHNARDGTREPQSVGGTTPRHASTSRPPNTEAMKRARTSTPYTVLGIVPSSNSTSSTSSTSSASSASLTSAHPPKRMHTIDSLAQHDKSKRGEAQGDVPYNHVYWSWMQ